MNELDLTLSERRLTESRARQHVTSARSEDSNVQSSSAAVLRMIQGLHISRAVYVAAKLGIADLLADGPARFEDLAHRTQTHPRSLYRILRLLAALEVFVEIEPGRFALSPLGERLQRGVPSSQRAWALILDSLGGLRPFDHIIDAVRTGEPVFEKAMGMSISEFFSRHSEELVAFQDSMSERTAAFAPTVAAGYDFAPMRTVVDVGGGRGTLLAQILAAHPHLHGILFERPATVRDAETALRAPGMAERCDLVGGDFFASVPSAADGYILANVLHDWDDPKCVSILRRCRHAMAAGARILVVERMIVSDPAGSLPTLLSDLNMMVLTGGLERTTDEYAGLFADAELRLTRVIPVLAPYGIFEAAEA